MIGNFNEEAQTILNNAKKEMIGLGHPYIGTEHLLLAILNSDSNICDRLSEYGLEYDNFKSELCKVVGTTDKKNEVFLYTPLLRKVIQNAIIDCDTCITCNGFDIVIINIYLCRYFFCIKSLFLLFKIIKIITL